MRFFVAFACLATGCFSVDFGDGKLECGPNGYCPSGLTCSPLDNRCYLNGQVGQPDASIPTIDGGGGADVRTADAPIDVSTGAQPEIHYAFDNDLTDSGSLHNAAGVMGGSQAFTTGKFGQAAHFPTNVSYVDIANDRTFLGAGSGAYTIAVWVNTTASGDALMFSNDNRATSPYGGIELDASSGTIFMCSSNAANAYIEGSCASSGTISAGVWHSVVVEWDGTALRVYVDDVLTHTVAAAGSVFSANVTTDFVVGGGGLGTGVDIDDLKVFTQVFDAQHRCTDVIGGTYAASTCTLP